jgi:hypothetical protein
MAATRKPKPAPPLMARPEPVQPVGEVAAVDLIIERRDLGIDPETGGTFVRAGDPIPPGLERLPRRPA